MFTKNKAPFSSLFSLFILSIMMISTDMNAQLKSSISNEIVQYAFGTIKQVKAGVLDIGYVEAGPKTGTPVVLIHGWPYDIHSFEKVTPILVAQGYHVYIPYLRGFGTTRFLSEDTPRNGQQSAIASDMIAFMDALNIDKAIVGGFDWGARTAIIMGALWPERCKAIVSVSGYIVVNLTGNQQPLSPVAEHAWWYQYYFSTDRGQMGYEKNRYEFNKLIWKLASPKWIFDNEAYEKTAPSFDNPDHVAIVIHNYRWRLKLAEGEKKYDELEKRLDARPNITIPAVTIGSDFDGANANGKAYSSKFTGKYAHHILNGIGHDVPQEDPKAFADAIIEADAFTK